MSRMNFGKLLKILLLMLTFSSWFNLGLSFGSLSNEIFELEIVGYTDYEFIPGPCPPGVHCTYDSRGWDNLVLGLTYIGNSYITIVNIQVTQILTLYGSSWTRENWNQIISQNITLSQGDSFYFLAEGIYTLIWSSDITLFFPIKVKITDIDENIYWLDKEPPESPGLVTDSQFLSRLPFIKSQGFTPTAFFLFLLPLSVVIKLKRKYKRKEVVK